MKDINEKPSVITADLALFDFLQEKTGERKTRTEAYCDLLDKASAGYVSPFVKKSDVILKPRQCHVTITDLADQWKWHRATIRSFMERLEELGQLETDKQPKSVVITMPCDANIIRPHVGTLEERFAKGFSHILSEWVNGNANDKETGRRIEQYIADAISLIDKEGNNACAQGSLKDYEALTNRIQHIALTQIVSAIFQQTLQSDIPHRGTDQATSALEDFFNEDLGGDWQSFMEAGKMLAEVILNGDSPGLAGQSAASKSAFVSLCKPFKAMLAERMDGLFDGNNSCDRK